jgi:hypothetical protein
LFSVAFISSGIGSLVGFIGTFVNYNLLFVLLSYVVILLYMFRRIND